MGKGGELWDDSALVDAFDHAIATYKAMHGKNKQAAPSEKEESEAVAAAAASGEEPVSTVGTDENAKDDNSCTNVTCDAMEAPLHPCEEKKTTEQAPLEKPDLDQETLVSESKIYSSGVTDAERKDSSNQQTGDYNELLTKYYELEEQSRKVLEQLYQTNYWDHQMLGQSSVYQQQVPAYSATAPDPQFSTTQSSCCCLNAPLVSVSCCSNGQPNGGSACMPPSGGCTVSLTCDQCPGASTAYPTSATCMQLPTKVPTNDDEVAKAATMPAEAAMNFMKSRISGDPGSFPGKEAETGKEENSGMGVSPSFDTTGADSDLAVLLNAWYAAGFYTARYLMQQSMKNSRQG